jgi:hypothetical protein
MRRPPPRTVVAGLLDTGNARVSRRSCRCVPCPVPGPPLCGGHQPRRRMAVVRPRRRGSGGHRPPQRLARRPTRASRDSPGRGARAVSQAAIACEVPRSWATRACPRRAWGAAGSGGPCEGARARREAGGTEVSRAPVVGPEDTRQGEAAGEVGGFAGGPAGQQVATDRRICLVKPWQDMRAGIFARPGQAMREAAFVAAQAAGLDEGRPGAPGGSAALRGASIPVRVSNVPSRSTATNARSFMMGGFMLSYLSGIGTSQPAMQTHEGSVASSWPATVPCPPGLLVAG